MRLPNPREIDAIEGAAEARFARVRAEATALDRSLDTARTAHARARRMVEMQERALAQLDASGRRRMIGRTLSESALSGAISTVRQMADRLEAAREGERRAAEGVTSARNARDAFEPTLRAALVRKERKLELGGHARSLLKVALLAREEREEEDELADRAALFAKGAVR